MVQKDDLRIQNLKEYLETAQKAVKYLQHSYSKVLPLQHRLQNIQSIEQLDMDQIDDLEAFSARFARSADILCQKVFRAIDVIELVDTGSIIDRLNRMEKRGLIESAQDWKQIREERNEIAHDYVIEDNQEFYLTLINLTPKFFDATVKIEKWVNEKFNKASN